MGNYRLKAGSVYTVTIDEKKVTGIFRGYVIIGSVTTLAIEDDDGIIYIPATLIVTVRLVKNSPQDRIKSPKDVYYG